LSYSVREWVTGIGVAVAMLALAINGAFAQTNDGQPVADFRATPRNGVAPLEVQFSDQSFAGKAPISKWKWEFGDGETATEPNPKHVFGRASTYSVRLDVETAAGSHFRVKDNYIHVAPAEEKPAAAPAGVVGTVSQNIQLTPLNRGSRIRVERPESPETGFVLWGPEVITFPPINTADSVLEVGSLDWHRDAVSGSLWYTIDHPEGTFTARFTPHADYVECLYSVEVSAGKTAPGSFINPCQGMFDGIFEGGSDDLLRRIWFLSEGVWTTVGSCPDRGLRNFVNVKGNKVQTGGTGTASITSHLADYSLIACVSRDGQWISATASESNGTLFCNALPAYQCIHSYSGVHREDKSRAAVRVYVYLLKGTLDDLKKRVERDRDAWRSTPP